ncbi:MAG TPA: hypothetical protein VHE30_21880 [Polyangiaceae bacterium]|nr:hypothetical protein [Polyangiaceae bacterium]
MRTTSGFVSSRRLVACGALLGVACSSTAQPTPAESGKTPSDAGGSAKDFRLLAQGDWQLDPGSEGYFCVRKTIAEDEFVSGFRPISPLGTHHTVLSIDTSTADAGARPPDGTTQCQGVDNSPLLLGGSGVGTTPYEFPPGVAVKLPAGSQILLNIHAFNSSDQPLTGTSGIEGLHLDPSAVEHEAELVEAGKVIGLTVAPGRTTQTGTCTLTKDATIFASNPHMHRLGVHQVARLLPTGGAPVPLVDQDYSFDEQTFHMLPSTVAVHAGDQLEVDCTYENDGADTVVFGQSSKDEMCFAATYVYPPIKQGGFCFQ